jgi:GNAT superfamily N-acetyltransferase
MTTQGEDIAIEAEMPVEGGLAAVNALIERAIEGWDLSPRVKRAAAESYRYDAHDAAEGQFLRAFDADGALSGVAVLLAPDPRDADPAEARLLHGLFVAPERQGHGVGARLLEAAGAAARDGGATRLIVRAQRGARDYFRDRGFQQMADAAYPHSFVKMLA